MTTIPHFEADDLDWALGELYRLTKVAAQQNRLPQEINPALFHACYAFITSCPTSDAFWYRNALLNLMNFWLRRSRRRYANTHA